MKSLLVFLFAALVGLAAGWLIIENQSQPLPLISPVADFIAGGKFQIVGFWPFWSTDKISDIPTSLNQIAYFSLPLAGDGHIAKLANAREENPGWTKYKSLDFKDLAKHSLSLVVFSGDEQVIAGLIATPEANARNLVGDVAPLMQSDHFSDLNLDIESTQSASAGATLAFTQFVAAVKQEMINNKIPSLTLDLQPIALFQSSLTDPVALGKIVDHVVLMTYDFHYPGSILAGPVAPLNGAGSERVWDVSLSARAAANLIPAAKIILGVPVYGYEWQTLDAAPGSPVIPDTGVLASDKRIASSSAVQIDTVAAEPYAIWPDGDVYHQAYFENSAAIIQKLQLAHALHLGGVAFWALGYETTADWSALPAR